MLQSYGQGAWFRVLFAIVNSILCVSLFENSFQKNNGNIMCILMCRNIFEYKDFTSKGKTLLNMLKKTTNHTK